MWSKISPYSVVDEEGNLIGYLQQEGIENEKQEGRVNKKQESFWKRLFGKIY